MNDSLSGFLIAFAVTFLIVVTVLVVRILRADKTETQTVEETPEDKP